MDELMLPGLAAAQVAYHLRTAVGFAATGDADRCGSETMLAWTILSTYSQPDPAIVAFELPAPLSGTATQRDALEHRTEALALEMQSHFVSEGQHETAAIYESAARNVRGVIVAIQN